MNRDEHVAWCKTRALAYVDAGDLNNAFASMCSDLRKHPDTARRDAHDRRPPEHAAADARVDRGLPVSAATLDDAGPVHGEWIPVKGRGLVFITDDLAAAIDAEHDRVTQAAVSAERVRILLALREARVDCELGPCVLERTVVAIVQPEGVSS